MPARPSLVRASACATPPRAQSDTASAATSLGRRCPPSMVSGFMCFSPSYDRTPIEHHPDPPARVAFAHPRRDTLPRTQRFRSITEDWDFAPPLARWLDRWRCRLTLAAYVNPAESYVCDPAPSSSASG